METGLLSPIKECRKRKLSAGGLRKISATGGLWIRRDIMSAGRDSACMNSKAFDSYQNSERET
jgi:hypothetical protein